MISLSQIMFFLCENTQLENICFKLEVRPPSFHCVLCYAKI